MDVIDVWRFVSTENAHCQCDPMHFWFCSNSGVYYYITVVAKPWTLIRIKLNCTQTSYNTEEIRRVRGSFSLTVLSACFQQIDPSLSSLAKKRLDLLRWIRIYFKRHSHYKFIYFYTYSIIFYHSLRSIITAVIKFLTSFYTRQTTQYLLFATTAV